MKSLVVALAVVVLAASAASAGWTYVAPVVAPAPVVYNYWPVGPVYTYPAPVPYMPAPYMVARPAPYRVARPVPYRVARPVMVAPPVYAPAPFYAPAPVVYAPPYVVRSKVFIPGRPIRNIVRAVLP